MVLKDIFGFDGFKKGQEAATQAIMSGNDALVILATGGGKSLCYQLAPFTYRQLGTRASVVVVSPLISLMSDQWVFPLYFCCFCARKIAPRPDETELTPPPPQGSPP